MGTVCKLYPFHLLDLLKERHQSDVLRRVVMRVDEERRRGYLPSDINNRPGLQCAADVELRGANPKGNA